MVLSKNFFKLWKGLLTGMNIYPTHANDYDIVAGDHEISLGNGYSMWVEVRLWNSKAPPSTLIN